MMKSILAYVMALTLTTFSWGQIAAPKVVISGADAPIPLGELVTLKVTVPMPPANLSKSSFKFSVFEVYQDANNPDKLLEVKEKKYVNIEEDKLFFGSGLKNHKVTVVVAPTFTFVTKNANGDVIKTDVVQGDNIVVTVLCGEDAPPTPPTPPDPPKPDPTFPDGTFKGAATTFGFFKGGDYKTSKIAVADAKKLALAEATNIANINAKIAAGTYNTIAPNGTNSPLDSQIKQVLADVKAANDASKSSLNIKNWADAKVEGQLSDFVFGVYSGGKLTSLQDLSTLLSEIAAGAKAYGTP